jgi:hypothetical protein
MSQQDVINAEMMGGMYGPNPYSAYQGRIPLPGYRGTPTDAMGNPIAPSQGTTLNSTPAAVAAPAAAAPTADPNAGLRASLAGQGGYQGNPQLFSYLANQGPSPGQTASLAAMGYPVSTTGTGANTAGTASPASPAQGSWMDATGLLSNPGKVTTPGATVPQSTVGSQPSVLQQFLSNQKGGSGAGGYNNAGFFDTLNALGSR